jgi:signal transduction histidine kinase/DNA-binding response OmpR family regulator/HAMP domain-containing protein
MKTKNLKIGVRLLLGFGTILVFVLILGGVSYWQSNQLWKHVSNMYEHPLQVSRATRDIKSDVLAMHRAMKDLVMSDQTEDMERALKEFTYFESDAHQSFVVVYDRYLGPKADIDSAYRAFLEWKVITDETRRLMLEGHVSEAYDRTKYNQVGGNQVNHILNKIQVVIDFAKEKGDSFYADAKHDRNMLFIRLGILLSSILILSAFISYLIIRGIRNPLRALKQATDEYRNGNYNARSAYKSTNEIGVLSATFNNMAASVQADVTIKENAASFAEILTSENELRPFCKKILEAFVDKSEAQVAAIYFLNPEKSHFEHFESVGMRVDKIRNFSARASEGELGTVLSEKKIVRLHQIPDDTPFVFSAVTGEFKPREIVTIPILELGEVVGIISLATLHGFSGFSLQLFDDILVMLSARINGVLAFKKTIDFSAKLDLQNRELERQSKEMAMQADELKEYNIELELQKKQLDEANKLKSAFLSNMSHELRTPLNSVIALSGVLNRRLKDQVTEDEYNYLGIIEKNGKQLLSLINDILDLSRIEAGREEINNSRFLVQSLVKNILDSLGPIAEEKGIHLINHIQSDLPPIISDSDKCYHILQNIIGNAVKFTEKGSVEVTAELKRGKLYVGIKDTGIGIAQKHLPFIFDEFRQADGKSSRKYGGTGLGLAIAQKYTQMLNGSIEVSSQEDAGSIFVVMLPEKPFVYNSGEPETEFSQIPLQDRSASPAEVKRGFGKTLLLVEDSEPQLIQLTDILKDEGYHILIARNGKEALEAIQVAIPNAMILDLMMPEVDGFEVLKSIRAQKETSQIPVLILSAKHVTKQELSFLKSNHIHQLIQKGDVNRNELLAHVSNMTHPEAHKVSAGEKGKTSSKPISGKATVLLIEDNEDNITIIKALLEEKYELISAGDGFTGLEKAKAHIPDLIFLDISLPQLDGFKVLKAIKTDEQLQGVPVIALTARAMKGDREELLNQGFDDYVSKPIDSVLFEKTILKWLDRQI